MDVVRKLTEFKQSEKRTDNNTDIRKRYDRVGQYLKCYLDDFVFDEFSDVFLEKLGLKELMKGVPVPLRKSDVEQFKGGQGLKTSGIAENMIWIMGIDPKFKYIEHYLAFLLKLYNYKALEDMLKKGENAAKKDDFDNACIHFRACLCMKPDYVHAMYNYARVCREMYSKGGDEEYVGNFKAESIHYFEILTEVHPDFAYSYYYLGYAYLNLGLYAKADIVWRQFLEKVETSEDKAEVVERLKQLEGPIKIESGCNDIMAGRYEGGISKLEPYLDSQFKTWWPLPYYLGVAYSNVGELKEAVSCFKKVLGLNPSHTETMQELVDIYSVEGDEENKKKYSEKIELIKSQMVQN